MKNNEQTRNILVAVDVQNDFISGSLLVHEGERVVEPINTIADAVRSSNGTVVFTRDWHPGMTPHFADYGGAWPAHCIADTEGAAFHPGLTVKNDDVIISKGMEQTDGYSGWEGTSDDGLTLETIITPGDPKERARVLVGGLATDYCVRATALDIAEHFKDDKRVSLYLLRGAIRAVGINENDEDEALTAMAEANIHAISTEEAIALIEGTAL